VAAHHRRVAVIQARMGSTRLPGKVLRDLGGRSVLSWVVDAARDSGALDEVVVATTTDADDDVLAAHATDVCGVPVVRGPIDDVLSRYLLALDTHGGDVVVRLTADCPLLDPALIALLVRAFDPSQLDYLSTNLPRSLAHGWDVEVTTAAALRRAGEVATDYHRVHVTSYLYSHPDEFRIAGIAFTPPCDDLRVTLDEPADAELLDAIVAELGPQQARNWRAVAALLRARPDLVAINGDVRQKQVEEG
jgi:spore coat polysaccharide biosynthesis protein SpsF